MKIAILNIFLLLVSSSVFAADYICQGAVADPVIEIIEVDGRPQFRYLVDGKVQLSLSMNEGSVQPVTLLPIGFNAGQTFTFRPGYGESIVHIYGRILSRGAVFDIFVSGMLDNVQKTLVDYECSVRVQS